MVKNEMAWNSYEEKHRVESRLHKACYGLKGNTISKTRFNGSCEIRGRLIKPRMDDREMV